MQHGDIWRGIDLLAEHHGLSTSGLAKLAGLDATAFNKSKRLPKDGRPRWPSTESISRILAAVGTDFEAFAKLVSGRESDAVPLLTQAELEAMSTLSPMPGSGAQPVQTFALPTLAAIERCFAVEVGNDELSPTYAAGDCLIASPDDDLGAGDRVIVKPQGQRVLFGTICEVSSDHLVIETDSRRQVFEHSALEWTARILWVRP